MSTACSDPLDYESEPSVKKGEANAGAGYYGSASHRGDREALVGQPKTPPAAPAFHGKGETRETSIY